jgi:hypothetical protein
MLINTMAAKGERNVIIRTTSSKKQQCTVMLAITADVRK